MGKGIPSGACLPKRAHLATHKTVCYLKGHPGCVLPFVAYRFRGQRLACLMLCPRAAAEVHAQGFTRVAVVRQKDIDRNASFVGASEKYGYKVRCVRPWTVHTSAALPDRRRARDLYE